MTLDTFLQITETRVPTVEEMISLADELKISFSVNGKGQTVMRPCPECRDEAMVLARLFRREPFRSKVIAEKLPEVLAKAKEQPKELEPPPPPATEPPVDQEVEKEEPKKKVVPPPGAMVFVADEKGYNNEHRKGEPYQWTYEGAETWWYVKDHPPPPQYLASPKNSESTKKP